MVNRQTLWRKLIAPLAFVAVLCVLVVVGRGHSWGLTPVEALFIVFGTAVGASLRKARKHTKRK